MGRGQKACDYARHGRWELPRNFRQWHRRTQTRGSIIHFALRTSDCDAAIERARAAGATVTIEPKSVNIPSEPHETPVRIAFCKGPDGEVIEFFQKRTDVKSR